MSAENSFDTINDDTADLDDVNLSYPADEHFSSGIHTMGKPDSGISNTKRLSISTPTLALPRCKFSRQQIMKFCAETIAFLHPIASYSVYLIVPYYVLATPEKGWDTSDLALFFSAISIGEIVGSQVVPISALLDSDTALFCGHAIQIIATMCGYFLMSSLAMFDVYVFAAGMFLLGFGYGMSSVQAYCTEIADGDESEEVELMAMIGQLYIVSNLVSAFALPAIYDFAGYAWYCVAMMGVTVVMLIAFVVLMLCLRAKQRAYKPSFHAYGADDETEDVVDVDTEEKETYSAAAAQMKSDALDGTHIPLLSILSPSMYALLLLKMAQCLSFQVYCIAYPVAFAQDFKISSQMGGLLYGAASVLGMFGLFVNSVLAPAFVQWQYPYDVVVYFGLLALSCLLYVVVYEAWLGYSVHLIAMATIMILSGVEMTTRLFLCPSRAFQKVTGVVGLLQAATYLLGSLVTPYMLSISTRFPFLFVCVLATTVSLISLAVFAARSRFLKHRLDDDDHAHSAKAVGYLSMERAFYSRIKKSAYRRGAMRSDQQISMLDDIQSELHSLQTQFSSRRGLSFLMNPMASRRLEQFANNAAVAVADASHKQSAKKKDPRFNPNALIQRDELEEMKEAIVEEDEEDEDELALAIDSVHEQIKRISNPQRDRDREEKEKEKVQIERVARASRVQQSRISMRKSVLRIADEGTRKRRRSKARAKISMARQSMFRACEPAIALNGRGKGGRAEAEREAVRRATVVAKALHSPMSLFRL